MREAEVLAGLTEAEAFEDQRRATIDERMAIASRLIQRLGGKSKLRGVLGIDDMTFRHIVDGLSIEAPGGEINIRMKGLEASTIEFYKLGPTPISRKLVKKVQGVSHDRMLSVLKKHGKGLFEDVEAGGELLMEYRDYGAGSTLKSIREIRNNEAFLHLVDLATHDMNSAWNSPHAVRLAKPVRVAGLQFLKALVELEKLAKVSPQ